MFVSFGTGSDVPESSEEYVGIGMAAEALRQDTDLHAVVIGHADASGSTKLNEQLSLRRARKVRAAMLSQGISANRVGIAARGAGDPIASNQTEEGRAKNRRTEIYFYYPSRGSAGDQYGVRLEVRAE
jgi:outer membrane protein OmpA-like peptidoglycan-associated protein